jgi:hypothetical protein
MADIPHEWSLSPAQAKGKPTHWASDAEFASVVLGIRRYGVQRKFRSTKFTKLDVNDRYYWTCSPLLAPPEICGLINRAVRNDYEPPRIPYVTDVRHVAWAMEDIVTVGKSVLDIGATYPEARETAASYTAIGATADLTRVDGEGIDTDLYGFVPRVPWRFDVVLALSGAVDALSPSELWRLPSLVAPGGVVVAMTADRQSPPMLTWSEVVDMGTHLRLVMRMA